MKKTVLFLTNHSKEDGSARYRIYQFLPYLTAAGWTCQVRPFTSSQLFGSLRSGGRYLSKAFWGTLCSINRLSDLLRASRADLIVIHREAFPFFMPLVENLFLLRHKKVIFSFDDAIYTGHGETAHLSHPLLYRIKYGSGVNKLFPKCCHVIAGNQTLAAHVKQFSPHVTVMPTVVDLNRYPFHDKAGENKERVTIGWFGSPSTSSYLREIAPALLQIESEWNRKVQFRFFGDSSIDLGLKSAEYLPFSLKNEIEDLRSLDIGLMPMPDTPWTQGKCSFKAIQYLALGIPAVVSPVGSAQDLISHGENGFYATSIPDWVNAMNALLQDPRLRQSFSRRGRTTVEDSYSLQVWAPKFTALLEEMR